jgi:hypothetical protein
MISASSLRGGNLASITRAGLFLCISRRSLRERIGRQPYNRLLRAAARLSIVFSQPAHKFRAHNTDRHHAALPVRLGAAGIVMRTLPRLLPFSEINHVSHLTPPCDVNSIGAAFPRGGNIIREERNGPHI